jgi:hypothetical protein
VTIKRWGPPTGCRLQNRHGRFGSIGRLIDERI